ncbi:MAG: hypothetical protein HY303_21410 [Candidatus Wallbacteria bacterium]|nr:hypothetical protein [Candidatus Wallbacteria bacterium]
MAADARKCPCCGKKFLSPRVAAKRPVTTLTVAQPPAFAPSMEAADTEEGSGREMEIVGFFLFLILVTRCAFGIAAAHGARPAARPPVVAGRTDAGQGALASDLAPIRVADSALVADGQSIRVSGLVSNSSDRKLLRGVLCTRLRDAKGKLAGTILCNLSTLAPGKSAVYQSRGELDVALPPGQTLEWKTSVVEAQWAPARTP